jgi:hypothetical protein
MKAQPTTKQLIEMLYERLPELFDRAAAQPATEESSATQPAVPDALTTADGENASYTEGWNDCRSLMLKGMKP